MKVGFAPSDWVIGLDLSHISDEAIPMGSVGFQRIGQYLPYLSVDHTVGILAFDKKEGVFGIIRVDNPDMFHNPDDRLNVEVSRDDISLDCDVIYMQRNMGEQTPFQILEARANGQVVINDIDDVIWDVDERNYAHDNLETPGNTTENYMRALEASSAVVASTDYIKDHLLETNPYTATIKNYIDLNRFTKRVHKDGPIRVGWVGSTAHRSGDLEILKPMGSEFRWVHGGHAEWTPYFGDEIGAKNVITFPSCLHRLYPKMFKFDVGVVPLTDVPFNIGKSYLKGLEYAAAGVPFIASDVGEYSKFSMGLLAATEDDWRAQIHQLEHLEVRQREADRNNLLVKQFDTETVGVVLFEQFLKMAASLE